MIRGPAHSGIMSRSCRCIVVPAVVRVSSTKGTSLGLAASVSTTKRQSPPAFQAFDRISTALLASSSESTAR